MREAIQRSTAHGTNVMSLNMRKDEYFNIEFLLDYSRQQWR